MRRRRLFAALLAVALAAGIAALVAGRLAGGAVDPPEPIRVVSGGRQLAVLRPQAFEEEGRLDRMALGAAVSRALPPVTTVWRGPAAVTYRYDASATTRLIAMRMSSGGSVEAVRRPVAAQVDAPVIRQALRNNCEAATLSVVLATTGLQVPQLRLQDQLPTSGPLDPTASGPGGVWGDPELGFVGRPDGGGVAGGFGVYQRPIAALARRYGRRLQDRTGSSPSAIYQRLLEGRVVMAWVGLSSGPYGEWTSPAGRRVRVNFGEHTVVLAGLKQNGDLRVVNPLVGTRETWSKAKFEAMWQLLGRRALST